MFRHRGHPHMKKVWGEGFLGGEVGSVLLGENNKQETNSQTERRQPSSSHSDQAPGDLPPDSSPQLSLVTTWWRPSGPWGRNPNQMDELGAPGPSSRTRGGEGHRQSPWESAHQPSVLDGSLGKSQQEEERPRRLLPERPPTSPGMDRNRSTAGEKGSGKRSMRSPNRTVAIQWASGRTPNCPTQVFEEHPSGSPHNDGRLTPPSSRAFRSLAPIPEGEERGTPARDSICEEEGHDLHQRQGHQQGHIGLPFEAQGQVSSGSLGCRSERC